MNISRGGRASSEAEGGDALGAEHGGLHTLDAEHQLLCAATKLLAEGEGGDILGAGLGGMCAPPGLGDGGVCASHGLHGDGEVGGVCASPGLLLEPGLEGGQGEHNLDLCKDGHEEGAVAEGGQEGDLHLPDPNQGAQGVHKARLSSKEQVGQVAHPEGGVFEAGLEGGQRQQRVRKARLGREVQVGQVQP